MKSQTQRLHCGHWTSCFRHCLRTTGYTNDTSPGGAITNESLAQRRSENVIDYLILHGVARDAITMQAKPLCCYIALLKSANVEELSRYVDMIRETQLYERMLVATLSPALAERRDWAQ